MLNHYLTREDSLGARATVLRQAAVSALDTQSAERGKSLTDASYSESIRQAHKWQTLLSKKYSPLYDGDGR